MKPEPAKKPHARGKPAHTPTQHKRQQVEGFAAVGTKHAVIAKLIGVSIPTLEKYYSFELDNGKDVANGKIGGVLYKKALDGDTASVFFWLKTQAGFRETNRHELAGDPDSPLRLQINAAAAKLDAKLKEIMAREPAPDRQ